MIISREREAPRFVIRSTTARQEGPSSPLVGSSAIRRSGSTATHMAIITRWAMPPDSLWGYVPRMTSGSLNPHWESRSTESSLQRSFGTPVFSMSSLICGPMRMRGSKDCEAFWETMHIPLPLTSFSLDLDIL